MADGCFAFHEGVVMEHALNHRAQCGDVTASLKPIRASV